MTNTPEQHDGLATATDAAVEQVMRIMWLEDGFNEASFQRMFSGPNTGLHNTARKIVAALASPPAVADGLVSELRALPISHWNGNYPGTYMVSPELRDRILAALSPVPASAKGGEHEG